MAVSEVCYCTREDVKQALDIADVARVNVQIDREIQSASRSIEGDTLRLFYPTVSTQTFDWPDHQYSLPWRLWLDDRELTAITQVTTAGTDITSSVMTRPDQAPMRGQPYTYLEVDLSTNAAFTAGATFQRSISITGVFGFCAADQSDGSLAAALTDTTSTAVTVSDSSQIGVGSLIRVDTERLLVRDRAMAATSATITSTVQQANNAQTIPFTGGTFATGETILVDAEKMRIDEIAGTNLIVTRAWDGSTLAQHSSGAVIWAPRLLTVQRGAVGTTAATHSLNAPVYVHQVPSLIRDWAVAEAMSTLQQERRGYTQPYRRASGGDPKDAVEISAGLADKRSRAMARYARLRTRTAERAV